MQHLYNPFAILTDPFTIWTDSFATWTDPFATWTDSLMITIPLLPMGGEVWWVVSERWVVVSVNGGR